MPPRVEGLSFKQTRALRLLAIGGGAMPVRARDGAYSAGKVRFTHPKGGLHIDIPLAAVKDRLVALGYVKNMGLGTYLITPEGKRISDETARAYKEEWEARVVARRHAEAVAPTRKPWWEQPTAETLEDPK